MFLLVNMSEYINSNNNLYNILQIEKSASNLEIKQSFRKLSMMYHSDESKIKIYKDILNAYEILSDPIKKSIYDKQICVENKDSELHKENKLENNNNSDSIENINNNIINNKTNYPEIIHKILEISLELAYKGNIIPLEIERTNKDNNIIKKEQETIYVNIPKGIDNNEIIIIKNKGNCINNTIYGDIKVQIKIIENDIFKRKGLDLILYKNITFKESICGFKFNLEHLNGKSYMINNVGNIIQNNDENIIKNLGLERDNYKGNLIIIFKIIYPKKLSLEQIEKLKNIL